MNPNAAIDMLNHEHKVILKVVEGLRKLALMLRAGQVVDIVLLKETIAFMREFADQCHHAKEEGYLFPAFVAHGVPLHGCPLDALLHEHEQGRILVGKLAEGIEALKAGTPGATDAIAELLEGIVKLYPNHIWKEEEMVFPMAARLLPTEARAELYQQFEAVEAKTPPGTHERFHQFAERIAAVSS